MSYAADLPGEIPEYAYLDAVQDAAVWVETGQWAQEDIVLPEDFADAGIDLEAFVEDIETVREEHQRSLEADEPDTEETTDADYEVGDIDWAALWQEFSFETPDAVGSRVVSTTQLTAAVDVTDQGIPGDPVGHIRAAVDAGLLQEVYTEGDAGRTLRGYVLPGVNADG
jgi:hypothetical protein